MKLIAGLGNKGTEYKGTRHNVGFMFADFLASKLGFSFTEKNKYAAYATKSIRGVSVLFIKPLTYMNLSGEAVKFFADKHKISPEDILICHDDMDLPLFTVKLKNGGGDGGHNGIKSITGNLGTDKYPRIRFGVGRPENKSQTVDYVLGPFSNEETAEFEKKFDNLQDFIHNFVSMGYEKSAGRFKDLKAEG